VNWHSTPNGLLSSTTSPREDGAVLRARLAGGVKLEDNRTF